jgi:hypothetical protein
VLVAVSITETELLPLLAMYANGAAWAALKNVAIAKHRRDGANTRLVTTEHITEV